MRDEQQPEPQLCPTCQQPIRPGQASSTGTIGSLDPVTQRFVPRRYHADPTDCAPLGLWGQGIAATRLP